MLDFNWNWMGHSLVARFGKLSVSVCARGSKRRGDVRYRVDDVFGNPHLGSEWTDDLDAAKAEAERLANREARALARLVAGERGEVDRG